jgi:arylformamidase
VENLDLHHVAPGLYELYAAPLKIAGSDGAPLRAVLIQR